MRRPSVKDCLDELTRIKAENERLKRLVATQRPELDQLRHVITLVRDMWNNVPRQLEHLNDEASALMVTDDDLPTFAEIRGILSDGKDRVDAALSALPNGTPAFDAVGKPTTDTSGAITRVEESSSSSSSSLATQASPPTLPHRCGAQGFGALGDTCPACEVASPPTPDAEKQP